MEKLILLVADYANVDQGGKLNVLGAFGRIYAPQFPALHASLHLVVKLGADIEDFGKEKQFNVYFRDADGKILLALPTIPFTLNSKNMPVPEVNFIIQVQNLVLPSAGQYDFEVMVDGEEIGVLPITVDQIPSHS
ncbi:MAG: hypothetical protein H0X30_14600 [Anaerolineae bacterium]|nr:hypothetical protein [Anaerolineae bacterium]